MGYGRFDRKIELPAQGGFTVGGPFDPEDPKVDEADVLFLIVQGEGADSTVVKGIGKWKRGQHNNRWVAEQVDRQGKKPNGDPNDLYAGKVARGIALALVIRPGKLFKGDAELQDAAAIQDAHQADPAAVVFDPPQIEDVTWCADFMLTSPGQAT
jgi:hypothetical protein